MILDGNSRTEILGCVHIKKLMNKNLQKIFLSLVFILVAAGVFFWNQKKAEKTTEQPIKQQSVSQQTDSPKIVYTKPDPLENNIVGASDIIEITFNRPLENEGQFKVRIEPKVEFKIELTNNRKTARIIFPKSLQLGSSYTLFIDPDTKFDGVGNWGQDKIFHFHTVTYKGV